MGRILLARAEFRQHGDPDSEPDDSGTSGAEGVAIDANGEHMRGGSGSRHGAEVRAGVGARPLLPAKRPGRDEAAHRDDREESGDVVQTAAPPRPGPYPLHQADRVCSGEEVGDASPDGGKGLDGEEQSRETHRWV